MNKNIATVATNRKARHEYDILETIEAGMALHGSEIKSVRAGQINLKEGYVLVEGNQAWLMNVHIAPYDPASRLNHDPLRKKRLLLHKKEIRKMQESQQLKGLAIIPLRVYLKRGLAKVEVGVGRGLKKYDKRQKIAKKDALREMQRMLKKRD
jgi:SsrA-binding protein